MHVKEYIARVRKAEEDLASALRRMMKEHMFENDVVEMCERFAIWSDEHIEALRQHTSQGNEDDTDGPDLYDELFSKPRLGPLGLLVGLHALSLLIHDAHMSWSILNQAAMALRNESLEMACKVAGVHLVKESLWVETRAKNAAAQVLVVG